mgnify:CR=1 FL=1
MLPFFALTLVVSCRVSQTEKPLEGYYFPIKSLKNGLVYAYQPLGPDSAAVEYWYFRSENRGGRPWLVSQFYRPDFSVGQLVEEEIFENGAVARNILLFEKDSASGKSVQIPTTIREGNVFPFEKLDSTENLRFSLDWHPLKDPAATIFLKRTRQFAGESEPFFFKNKSQKTVRFVLREVVGNQNEGNSEVEGHGGEVYAAGLGLVFYKKEFDGGLTMAYRLVDTFSMAELERRAKPILLK